MIRSATAADVPALARLEAAALGRDAWSEALLREGVGGGLPTMHYLVAADGERLRGYAAASVVGEVAELQRIAVDPGHRRTGVATALLAAVVERAVAAGSERLLLEVREDNNAARGFYAARGFAELARRPSYYRDGAAAVVLERRLTGPPTSVWTTP